MPNKVQFRRGTDAERGTVVLDSGEPGWTTDTKELYVGDGVTYGGILVTGGAGGGAGTLCALSDVNCAGTANGKALTYQNGTWIAETPAGGGDMLISQYVTGAGTVYNATRLGGDPLATVQAHNVEATKITSGTFVLARIPVVDDARIPDLETLSYGAAFATAQIPSVGAYKIAAGTLAVARHETLDNLNGTVALAQVPTMDDGHIPDVEGLSYGGAFAAAQIPNLAASKITTGTFNSNRIPILPTDRYGSAVLLAGAQSIGGTKTFSDIPILPASDPTADNEAARKAYVDSAAGAVTEGTYTTSFTFGSAQAIQDAGTAFTIGGFMTHGYLKEVKFRANYTAGTFSTVSGKVNNASGILAAGTVVANDGRSGTFLIGDYIEIENETLRISGTVSPGTLIVSRAKKGSGAGFIDDNEDIVRLNSGFTLQLFKNTNKKKYEMPLMLSSLMTAKCVTDASISSGNKRIELSAELKNVDNLDTIRIDDGGSSEEALIQNNVEDCVGASYDYNLYVYDALGSHATSKTVEKVCKYDIPSNYKSTAGTLYGRVHLMESHLGSNLSINLDIKGDKF